MARVLALRSTRTERPQKAEFSETPNRRQEAAGVALLALALFLLLSTASLAFGDGKLMGPVGRWVAGTIYAGLGVVMLLCVYGLVVLAVRCLRGAPLDVRPSGVAGMMGIALCAAVLLHLLLQRHRLHGMPPGGALGEYGAETLKALLGTAGTALIGVAGLAISLLVSTSLSLRTLSEQAGDLGLRLALWLRAAAMEIFPGDDADGGVQRAEQGRPGAGGRRERGEWRRGRRGRDAPAEGVPILTEEAEACAPVTEKDAVADEKAVGARPVIVTRGEPQEPKRRRKEAPAPDDDEQILEAEVMEQAASDEDDGADAAQVDDAGDSPVDAALEEVRAPRARPIAPEPEPIAIIQAQRRSGPPASAHVGGVGDGEAPKGEYIKLGHGEFELPSIDLLDYQDQGQGDLDRQAMLDLAQRLEKTLLDYQVRGRVTEIHPGPVVTMYEFVPAPGTKLSKITALSNDLAMALEALRVRIVAPIPGKAAVGIEVPNKGRETVFLKEILADDGFMKAKSKLTLALGKDIAGLPVCVDLAKMPHLLVAGTTGSGKSVSVNTMVSSILFHASPDEVKMIMIDPKMLELSIYEGIPHLLLPVVTDPKKANLALRWAVDEMERRYELISKSGVRDITGYNKKVEKQLEERPHKERLEPRLITITVEGSDGLMHEVKVAPSEEAVVAAGGVVTDEIRAEISDAVAENEALKERLAREEVPRKLPFIVILIDEFADLMMVSSKEVETSVARIAQKARAAGIHLILATQRPSVDVITGLIKANFPSRIAFQVASRIDSRTILDAQGAENLLGMGDMLFTDRGQALRRIHGALITDSEIHRMVEHLKKQGQPVYDMEILKPRCEDEGEEGDEDLSDEMYDQAVRLVVESRQASISMIQRRLRIGYNRAARMVERMEREGIVSAADGAKGREVLVQG